MNNPAHHNFKHGLKGTRSYRAWENMKTRCYNPNYAGAERYAHITVCEAWLSFENFYTDIGWCPPGKSLERLDNNKGYCKENCKWATPTEQANNRRDVKMYRFDGKVQSMAKWSRDLNIPYHTLYFGIKRGSPGYGRFERVWP